MPLTKEQLSNKYYLYRHIRLDTGMPFYIGIGKKFHDYGDDRSLYARAYAKVRRTKHWRNVVDKAGYEVEILYESDDYDFIKRKEVEFIRLYGRKDLKTGYLVNRTDGGDGNYSDEFTQLMSRIHKGKVVSDEVRTKISNSMRGIKRSPISYEKSASSRKGKSLPSHVLIASAEKRKKPVVQLDMNNLFIAEHSYISLAANVVGCDRGDISKCCKGRSMSAAGFKWMYKSDYEVYINQKQQ